MTVQGQIFEIDAEDEQGQSAMAAAAEEPTVEELLVPPPPPIEVERILSASTMEEWLSLVRASVGSSELSQLHWDILSFCKAYELTAHQMQLRRDALTCVERAVRDIWPSAEVHLFGSVATGLALPWSDIDVAIIPPKQLQQLSSRKPPTPLSWQNALCRNLNRLGQCRSLQKLPFAKVPILKAEFKSGIACDVSFDVRNSLSGVSVIRQFVEQYEACRPLCLVLKFFLGQNNLNELHTGGLGSFCIITMVISHLQKMASLEAAAVAERRDLGTLLLSFFAQYSSMHDYSTDVVTTRGADCRSSKLDKGWVNLKKPQLLSVEDPLDATSDIAKGSHRVEEVRKKFSQAQRTLLTHWCNERVLSQIVDMTANPTQRPSPEKAKRSKRESRKRRLAVSGQEEHNSPPLPALKIQRRHHPEQGSGLVTKRQLDWILASNRGPHFTSLPTSPFLRTGGYDEEKGHSVQVMSPKIPSPNLIKRSHGNATLETTQSSPIMKPRRSCSKHPASPTEECCPAHKVKLANEGSPDVGGIRADPSHCSDLFTGQQDKLEGYTGCLEANNSFAPKLKARNGLKYQAAEGDCCPSQSARSQLCHSGVDCLGNRGNQDEKILVEFWESQLTSRSKPRKTPRRQREKWAQYRDVSRGQDSVRSGSQKSSETHNSAALLNLKKGPTHQATEGECPTQSAPHFFQEGADADGIRGNQDDRILEGFWESNLRTRSKPRKTSLNLCGTNSNGTPTRTVPIIHPERPRNGIKNHSNLLDGERVLQPCGAENNNLLARNGSKIQAEGLDEQSVKDCGTEGNNEQAQAVQAFHPERPRSESRIHFQIQDGESAQDTGTGRNVGHFQAVQISHPARSLNCSKIQPRPQDEKSAQPCRSGGSNEQPAQAVHTINPKPFQNGSQAQASPQNDEKFVVDLDFWEAQLTTKRKSRNGSLINQGSRGAGKASQPALAVHSEQPVKSKDVVGEVQDKMEVLVDVLDPHLTPKPKPRFDPCPKRELGDKKDQPARKVQEGILTDFWEAKLAPRVKSQKSSVDSQHLLGAAAKRRNSMKGPSAPADVSKGLRPIHHLDQPQHTGGDVNGRRGDERLLVDFWEAQLAPRLKAGKCLPKHRAAGCEDDDVQPKEKRRLDVQQPPQSSEEVLRVSPDERKLVDFWETHLNPTPRSKKCLSSKNKAEAEDESEKPNLNAVGSIDHGYDRRLVDFWEAHLTPSRKSQKGLLKHDGVAGDEDIPPVVPKTLNRELPPTQGNGFVGRSEDEAILSTFWEACLNPALSRKGYLRRKSAEVI